MARLTAKFIENVRPRAVRVEIPDGGCRGLALIVQPSGRRSWCVRYRHAGRTRKLTLNGFPSLADARRQATEALHELEQGRDPATSKHEARKLATQADAARKRDTIEQLVARFLDEHVSRLRLNTRRQAAHVFNDIVLPQWHGRNAHEIKRRDVNELVKDVAKAKPVMANRVLAMLSRFFSWLCENDIIEASPCVGVRRPIKETPRERTLTDREIVALLRACNAIGGPAGACVKLLLLLGQRRGEIAGMCRGEIDGDTWRIPSERMKANQPHVLPLPASALEIVESLPQINSGDRVFSAMNFGRIKEQLDAHMPAMPAWVFHDLRRSTASGMAALGIQVPVIEKILAHRSGTFRGVAATYQRHSFIPEMRSALERWSAHLDRLASGESAEKVVALDRRR